MSGNVEADTVLPEVETAMDTIVEPTVEVGAKRVFNALDRCDRCDAQALGYAEWENGMDLLFCGHHLRKHELRLVESGAQVVWVLEASAEKPAI